MMKMSSKKQIPSNSTELKALARTARVVVAEEAKWIAIDANGQVWAYDLKPTVHEAWNCWDNSDSAGYSWEISAVAPPEDFRQELYEISKLLEKTITKEQFKQIAQKASSESDGKAHWIAIDSDGEVWAYNIRPFTSGALNYWINSYPHNRRRWKIGMVAPPEDFRNELYEISKILNNEQ